MSTAKPASRNRVVLPDWLPHHHVLPLVLSVLCHALLLIACATALRWFERPPVGFSDEPAREIGIFVERAGDHPDSNVEGDPNGGAPSETSVESMTVTDPLAPTEATSETPPAETTLPSAEPIANIGPGVNIPQGPAVTDPRSSVRPGQATHPAKSGTKGEIKGSSFMGARDEGSMKVVFVIDASGSMTSYNAMQVAKGALLSSLQSLNERQQFLLIFYDDKPQVMLLHNESKPTLVPATDLNKTLARQKIAGIQPGSGTDHLPALKLALQMNPDTIYFLTDALDPPLWPQDLEVIKNMNGGRVHIHSIEFGQGPELDGDHANFLRKLARQNGGTYRYHDVTRFKTN